MHKVVRIYRDQDGYAPYEDWINDLRDVKGRAKIRIRIDRAVLGNFGDHRTVGGGVIELRIDYGPGYRVYLGLHGEAYIVLLSGGDKGSQGRDIVNAHEYWADYKRNL